MQHSLPSPRGTKRVWHLISQVNEAHTDVANTARVAGAGAVAREAGPRLRADAVVLAGVRQAVVAHETRAHCHRARKCGRIDHVAANNDVAQAAHERRVAGPVAAQVIRFRRLDVQCLRTGCQYSMSLPICLYSVVL